MIHRVWYHYHNVWVHAAVQMLGYLLFLGAAAIGIYMGAVEKKVSSSVSCAYLMLIAIQLVGFHPIMGMILLAGFTLQPFTELINYFLYRRWPKIKFIGHIHIWKGRTLLLVGLIHGGLGFAYSAKLDKELPMRKGPWPRVVPILYAIMACLVVILYTTVVIRKVYRPSEPANMDPEDMVENGVAFSVEQRSQFSQVRSSVRKPSESAPVGMPVPEPTTAGAESAELEKEATKKEGSVSPASPHSTPAAATSPSRMSSVKRIFRSDAL
jgi:hypothetical protein